MRGGLTIPFVLLAASSVGGWARAARPEPLVLYTDLLAGPNSGGENNKGCYLSIFGKNFGESTGLGATTKVFIGGVEVANYRYLGPSSGRSDLEQLTVQVGALGNPVPGTALPIEIQVDGKQSTSLTSQTFTVNPGKILFVSRTGNDATAIAGDILHPWRHLQTPEGALTGAWGAAQQGDVIVMRAGLWTDVGFGAAGRSYFVKLFGNSGSRPSGACGTGPITFTAYPTEKVTIHPIVSTVYGVFDGLKSGNPRDAGGNPKYSQWITISNLVISTGGINDGPINLETESSHWRVVNNDLSAPDAVTNRAAGVTGNGKYEAILGNHIHDVAGTGSRGETLLDHGIYIDSGSDWELAYNRIENITGGNGIQLYNSGHVTRTIDNISIHHNLIHDVGKHGLNIADTSGAEILIWSNVVYNTQGGCWRNNSVDLQGAKIWNNTFYNCNTGGHYAALMNDVRNLAAPITADFKNNIVLPSRKSGRYTSGEAGFSAPGVHITGNQNLWFGGSGGPGVDFDRGASFMNPRFVRGEGNPPDFHLVKGSAGYGSGDNTVSPIVISNYDLTAMWPGTVAVNRGAF